MLLFFNQHFFIIQESEEQENKLIYVCLSAVVVGRIKRIHNSKRQNIKRIIISAIKLQVLL